MVSPPKRRGRLPGSRAPKHVSSLRLFYAAVSTLQLPFERVFWWLEQLKSRLQDRLANFEALNR